MTNLRNIANDIYILVFTLLIIFASIIQSNIQYLKLDLNLVSFILSYIIIIISTYGILKHNGSLLFMITLLNLSLIINIIPTVNIISIIIFMCISLLGWLWAFNEQYRNESL